MTRAVDGELRLAASSCAVNAAVAAATRPLQGACIDSRKLRPGQLFVALPGSRQDGHEHVLAALEEGAGGALVSHAWAAGDQAREAAGPLLIVDDPLRALQEWAAAHIKRSGIRVVGVTGSNGKTTTKELIVSATGGAPRVVGSQGNYNNQIGLPLSVLALPAECRIAVLEMGMSTPGEISRLVEIAPPEVAVITSLGTAHLENFTSLEEIAAAKLEIVERDPRLIVLPVDAPILRRLARQRCPGANLLLCGLSEAAELRADAVQLNDQGQVRFQVAGRGAVQLALSGAHNVGNALASIAVAEYFGTPWSEIVAGLESVRAVAMRTEYLTIDGVHFINDAYNSNPASMRAALDLLRNTPNVSGRRALVVGAMLELGDDSAELHRRVGESAAAAAVDLLVAVGPLGEKIALGMRQALDSSSAASVVTVADAQEAAGLLAEWAEADDLVLVKASRGVALEATIEKFARLRARREGR